MTTNDQLRAAILWEDDGPDRICGYIDNPKITLFIIERNATKPYRGRMTGAIIPDEDERPDGLLSNALISWLQGYAAPMYLSEFAGRPDIAANKTAPDSKDLKEAMDVIENGVWDGDKLRPAAKRFLNPDVPAAYIAGREILSALRAAQWEREEYRLKYESAAEQFGVAQLAVDFAQPICDKLNKDIKDLSAKLESAQREVAELRNFRDRLAALKWRGRGTDLTNSEIREQVYALVDDAARASDGKEAT